MEQYLIFDHEPEEWSVSEATAEGDNHEEAAYGYTCDQSWMDDGDHIEIWVQEVDSGETKKFYCTRPYRDGAYDPEVEEMAE